MLIVPTLALYREALTQLAVPLVAGPLPGAELRLIKASFQPSPITDASTLTLADFDGYVSPVLPGGTNVNWHRYDSQSGYPVLQPAARFSWVFTAPVVKGNTIYGFALVGTDGKTLCSALLDRAAPMSKQTDVLFLDLQFGFVGAGNFGSAFQTN